MQVLPSPMLVDEQLLTKTHHTDMSNPEVPSRKRRSGDLGEVVSIGIHGGQSLTKLRSIHEETLGR